MKIPKYIQYKMHRIAQLEAKALEYTREIDAYFESLGYDIELLRCGNGQSLEELEYGEDITEEFVKSAEKDFMDAPWYGDVYSSNKNTDI